MSPVAVGFRALIAAAIVASGGHALEAAASPVSPNVLAAATTPTPNVNCPYWNGNIPGNPMGSPPPPDSVLPIPGWQYRTPPPFLPPPNLAIIQQGINQQHLTGLPASPSPGPCPSPPSVGNGTLLQRIWQAAQNTLGVSSLTCDPKQTNDGAEGCGCMMRQVILAATGDNLDSSYDLVTNWYSAFATWGASTVPPSQGQNGMIIVWSNPATGDLHIGVCDGGPGCPNGMANSTHLRQFADFGINGWGYPAGDYQIYDPQHIP